MEFKLTCPLWILALMAPLPFAAVTPLLYGQEVSPVVNGRVEAGPVLDAVAPRDEQRRGGLDLAVVISAAYDTNIYLDSANPTGDMVYRFGPLIAYTQGDSKEGVGGYIQASYQPMGVSYASEQSNNRIDHTAAVIAGWKGKASKITYKGVGRVLGDATADTGTPTERLELENEIRAAWRVREKVALEAAVGGWQTNYRNSALVDSGRVYGEAAVRYAYSPKTEVGLAYRGGSLKIENAASQTIQQVTGSFDWQPREKLRVKLDAGAEVRDSGSGSDVSPVMDARIEWTPRKGTRMFAAVYQRQEVSALNQGQIYDVKGVVGGLSQRLGGNWTLLFDVGYEVADYISESSTGAPSRTDRIWFVRPALNYQFSDELDASLFFRMSDDNSTDPAFGYDAATTGLELNYKF